MRAWLQPLSLLLLLLAASTPLRAETGADLWLRYHALPDGPERTTYRRELETFAVTFTSPTGDTIARELTRGLTGLLGVRARRADDPRVATLVIGTTASPAIRALGWDAAFKGLGDDGFVIRRATIARAPVVVVASNGESGALYGAFHLLRLVQLRRPLDRIDVAEHPRLARRLLNHWDNLDGSIERGYAGRSFFWPEPDAGRIADYARANASIGINGSVINSVNANPQSLTPPYLQKAAAIAAILRPYKIRVYLAANFAAPRAIGGLQTNDPLDRSVAAWWRAKADEIYKLIPDFGGFVVKANSEGQPGPQDYGRTHADGANVLADALAPHGGVVMWRAFVYNADVDPDRVKRAYAEFVPLDGKFRPNVFAQVKNGPLDFQPREPFHPMFGAMPKTPLMAELQITQEYLGQSNHLVYLAPMWKEFLDADTFARGAGSPVSKVIDGTLDGQRETGIAGVANTGLDANWTGHDFGQANWYAFGRLAWNPDLQAGAIADEWIRMTWGDAPDVVATIHAIMLESREVYVHYTMPLGLHHLIGGDHYAPMPENASAQRPDWTAVYYHHADTTGIGFDRTRAGSKAVDQYRAPLADRWNDPAATPDELLLWFHHLPWDYRMRSGRTLSQEISESYNRGVLEAQALERQWATLEGHVDDERFAAVSAKLHRQVRDAADWRTKCVAFFEHARSGAGK